MFSWGKGIALPYWIRRCTTKIRMLGNGGPVVPKLYKELQKYGSGQVTEELAAEDELDPASDEYQVLSGVWNAYRGYSGRNSPR